MAENLDSKKEGSILEKKNRVKQQGATYAIPY